MQTETVRKRVENNGKYESSFEDLSFRIYSVKNNAELTQDFKYDPKMLTEYDKLPFYLASREVTKRFSLKPGKYVIIPSMFEKNVNMKFLLRVFYESLNEEISSLHANVNRNNSFLNNEQNSRNTILETPVSKNVPLKPMSPISNKDSNKIDMIKPVVPPINKYNDGKSDDDKSSATLVDMKDAYNKWFYGDLSPIQIFNLVKEAQLASSKLTILKINS